MNGKCGSVRRRMQKMRICSPIMKSLFCLAVISLVTSEAADPRLILLRALVRGDVIISQLDSTSSSSSSSSSNERCTSGRTRECSSCSSAMICLPNGVQIATVNCSSFSPSTPFCNPENGLCTAQHPASCGDAEDGASTFPCPSEDGIYPDPDDCAQFHYCIRGIDTAIVCPKNNVYDHDLGTCKLRRRLSDCVKFDCARKEGQEILYPKDDRIWATCAGGKAYVMGRCKDYERYDVASRNCARVCRAIENQPLKGVCERYVRCADIGAGNLQPYVFPCPPGEGFDEVKRICTADAPCLLEAGSSGQNGDEADDENPVTASGDEERADDGETGAENRGGVSPRIISNAGNGNANRSVGNGDDEVTGNLVNGNENSGNSNSGNAPGSGNRDRGIAPRVINNSGDNNTGDNIANGDDNVGGNVINGNNNDNNDNSVNAAGKEGGSSSADGEGQTAGEQTPNLAEAVENLVGWLKDKITERPEAARETTEPAAAGEDDSTNMKNPQSEAP